MTKNAAFTAVGLAVGSAVVYEAKIVIALAIAAFLIALFAHRPAYGLYSVAALVPFDYAASLSGNMTAAKFAGGALFIAWLVGLARGRRFPAAFNKRRFLFLWLFLAAAVLSLIKAASTPVAIGRLTTLALLVGLYFVAVDLLEEREVLKKTLLVYLASALLASVLALSQFAAGAAGRAAGGVSDPNYSALNWLIVIPSAIGFFSEGRDSRRWWFLGAAVILTMGTLATLSKGAMVALAVMIISALILGIGEKRLRISLAVFLVIGLVLVALPVSSTSRFSRVTLSAALADQTSARTINWSTALAVWRDNPLLGVGLGHFPEEFYRYISASPVQTNPAYIKPMGAHNLYLQIATETGLLGLIAWLVFCFYPYRPAAAGRGRELAWLNIGFIGLLTGSLFLGMLYSKTLWLIIALRGARDRPAQA